MFGWVSTQTRVFTKQDLTMKITEYLIQLILLSHLFIVGLFKPEVAERAKRMLFLTSLATTLAREGIIKKNTLGVLNRNLKLAKNEKCLMIGEELTCVLWKPSKEYNLTFRSNWANTYDESEGWGGRYLPFDDIRHISERVIKSSPPWIRYNNTRMQEDVTDLFITNAVLKNVARV